MHQALDAQVLLPVDSIEMTDDFRHEKNQYAS